MYKKVFIIAEAGVNHNGSIDTAKRLIDEAKAAGADAVKFQTFKAERLVSKRAPKAEYQKRQSNPVESQHDMIKRLELDVAAHKEVVNYCKSKKILFLSSPFDLESVDLLNDLGLEIFKIPSGEIINLPYLRKIGRLRKKIILSTGMASLQEIKNALVILMEAGTQKKDIIALHCNSAYPTPFYDVNLRAMLTIKDAFGVDVGYSDHTLGIEVSVAAVALGARVVEKHFTLDRDMRGPDHKASIEPGGLKTLITSIRNIEAALGDGIKIPSPSELKNKVTARKGIVASKNIQKGEDFTAENVTTKRPEYGMSATEWDAVIGQVAKRNFAEDEAIEL